MKKFNSCFQKSYRSLKTQMVWCCLLAPSLSHAQTIESIISRTTTYLQGSLARSAGVISVVVIGYLCLVRHKFPKEQFIMVLVGLGIIFGGSSLYSSLVG